MANDTSATMRHEAPLVTRTTRTATVIDALKRRAQAVLNDNSIDPQSRAVIRYAMQVNDPWLAELVRRADAGETSFEDVDFSQTPETPDSDVSDVRIKALTEIVCRPGDEPETKSAALLVLMATIESSTQARPLANMAKHLAFTRCGELNLDGMVEAQIATVEARLLRESLSGVAT